MAKSSGHFNIIMFRGIGKWVSCGSGRERFQRVVPMINLTYQKEKRRLSKNLKRDKRKWRFWDFACNSDQRKLFKKYHKIFWLIIKFWISNDFPSKYIKILVNIKLFSQISESNRKVRFGINKVSVKCQKFSRILLTTVLTLLEEEGQVWSKQIESVHFLLILESFSHLIWSNKSHK